MNKVSNVTWNDTKLATRVNTWFAAGNIIDITTWHAAWLINSNPSEFSTRGAIYNAIQQVMKNE